MAENDDIAKKILKKKKKKRHSGEPVLEENVTPNLIPMIDIMFLLLLFLMLGADMGQRQMEDVILPVADSIKEDTGEVGQDGLTIVNVYHAYRGDCAAYRTGGICTEKNHWKIGVLGRDYTPKSIATLIKAHADLNRTPGNSATSERKVMIRADQAALYGYVNSVIEACALAGLYKIEIGAAERLE
jgi:biopolymer transport protein ExbD